MRAEFYQGSKYGRLFAAMADGAEWDAHRVVDVLGWRRDYASSALCALEQRGKIECVRHVPRTGRALKIYRRTDHA